MIIIFSVFGLIFAILSIPLLIVANSVSLFLFLLYLRLMKMSSYMMDQIKMIMVVILMKIMKIGFVRCIVVSSMIF